MPLPAFEGKLVPQDPTNELATVPLERIRARRGKLPYKRDGAAFFQADCPNSELLMSRHVAVQKIEIHRLVKRRLACNGEITEIRDE